MARSTRKSLAGGAAAAARKVIGRSSRANSTPEPASGKAGTTKKAAKKAAAKKAAAKKAPATKTPATKTPAKKAAKKAPATKTPAKKAAAKKAPATKTPAKKAAAKKTPATKAAAQQTATRSATRKAPSKTPAKKTATKKTATRKTATTKTTAGAGRPRKAPASALVVKSDESAWTKAELSEVLTDLHDHRTRLVAHLEEAERELAGLMRDSGDGAGHDQADIGSSSFERDHELTVVNNEREMLAQTDRALARIDDGTYGVCESCGEPIGKMRLMAFPRATLCLSCKQREERR